MRYALGDAVRAGSDTLWSSNTRLDGLGLAPLEGDADSSKKAPPEGGAVVGLVGTRRFDTAAGSDAWLWQNAKRAAYSHSQEWKGHPTFARPWLCLIEVMLVGHWSFFSVVLRCPVRTPDRAKPDGTATRSTRVLKKVAPSPRSLTSGPVRTLTP